MSILRTNYLQEAFADSLDYLDGSLDYLDGSLHYLGGSLDYYT